MASVATTCISSPRRYVMSFRCRHGAGGSSTTLALTGLVLFPSVVGSFLFFSFFSRNIPVEMWSTNPQVIGQLSQVMEKENAIQTGGENDLRKCYLIHNKNEPDTQRTTNNNNKKQPILSTHERVPARGLCPPQPETQNHKRLYFCCEH